LIFGFRESSGLTTKTSAIGLISCKLSAHPTDAKLMHRPRERLVRLAKKLGVELRPPIDVAPTPNNSRQPALKTVPAYLGRVTRDVGRKIKGKAELESFAHILWCCRAGSAVSASISADASLIRRRVRFAQCSTWPRSHESQSNPHMMFARFGFRLPIIFGTKKRSTHIDGPAKSEARHC